MRVLFSFRSAPRVLFVAAALLAGTHVLLAFLFAPDTQAQQLSGGFGEERPVSTVNEAYRASSVEVADVDGDGHQDIIFGSERGKIAWYRNQGDGQFGDQQVVTRRRIPEPLRDHRFKMVDVDRDGNPDIVSQALSVGPPTTDPSDRQNLIQIYENRGGSFKNAKTIAQISNTNSRAPRVGFAVGDLNNDGDRDIALRTPTFAGYVLREDGEFGPLNKVRVPEIPESEFGIHVGSVTLADVNEDGAPDLIVATEDRIADTENTNRIFWQENQIGRSEKAFGSPVSVETFSAASKAFPDVSSADVNGDGLNDIIGITDGQGFFATGEVIVSINKGSSEEGNRFESNTVGSEIPSPSSLSVEDVNEDGAPDIIVGGTGTDRFGNFSEGSVVVYNNDGSGKYPEKTVSLAEELRSSDVALGNISGSKKLEVVSASSGRKITYHKNEYNGFGPAVNIAKISRYRFGFSALSSVLSANSGRDNLPDVFASNVTGREIPSLDNPPDSLFRYENSGNYKQQFGPGKLAASGITSIRDAITISLEEDAPKDLVLSGLNNIYLAKNQGNGKFSTPSSINAGQGANRLFEADLNGDGLKDLLVAEDGANPMIYWFPNKGGKFGKKSVIVTSNGINSEAIALADINGDDRLDIVTSLVDRFDRITWFENRGGSFSGRKQIDGISSDVFRPYALAAGDITGNGEEDLAVCGPFDFSWLKNLKDGTISTSGEMLDHASSVAQGRSPINSGQVASGRGLSDQRQHRSAEEHSGGQKRFGGWGRLGTQERSATSNDQELQRTSPTLETVGGLREASNRGCTAIRIQDVNGDGTEDIVRNDGVDSTVPLLFHSNLGGARFDDPIRISDPYGKVTDFVLKDLSGNGRPDVYYSQEAPAQFAWAENQTIPPFVLGSPSGDSLVTAGDAALARRIAVGLARPNFADSLAADVSGNGAINAGDASLIEQYVVGLIEEFPTKAPGGATEGEALASGRLGRPQSTGSAEGGSPAQPMNRASGEIVWGEPEPVDSASGGASGEKEMMQVPIHLEDPQNVRAVQLELKYDPSSINVEDAEVGEVGGQEGQAEAKPWRAATNVQSDRGRVRMALSRVKPAKEGPVATLVVAVRERSPSGADAPETATLEGEAVLNDGTRQPLPETDVEPAPEALTVEPPSPNPFSQSTTLRYALPERQRVRIELYDVLGRRARTALSREQGAGRHAVKIGGDGLPSGTYFYRLQAGSLVRSGKLTIVR